MPPISNADVFYLSRAKYIEDEYKRGNVKVAYQECDEMLQDPNLPFYYRGHFHLILSKDDEDPVGHAMQGLAAFDRIMWQLPEDSIVAQYVLYAEKALAEAQKKVAQRSSEKGAIAEPEVATAKQTIEEEETVEEGKGVEKGDLVGQLELRTSEADRQEGPTADEIGACYAELRALETSVEIGAQEEIVQMAGGLRIR